LMVSFVTSSSFSVDSFISKSARLD
jgi:hypothetical protein